MNPHTKDCIYKMLCLMVILRLYEINVKIIIKICLLFIFFNKLPIKYVSVSMQVSGDL